MGEEDSEVIEPPSLPQLQTPLASELDLMPYTPPQVRWHADYLPCSQFWCAAGSVLNSPCVSSLCFIWDDVSNLGWPQTCIFQVCLNSSFSCLHFPSTGSIVVHYHTLLICDLLPRNLQKGIIVFFCFVFVLFINFNDGVLFACQPLFIYWLIFNWQNTYHIIKPIIITLLNFIEMV